MAEIPEMDSSFVAEHSMDGGDNACGELLLEIRSKLRQVTPGGVLQLITADSGALEDLPAWCRMTGNIMLGKRAVDARRTAYFIKKGE